MRARDAGWLAGVLTIVAAGTPLGAQPRPAPSAPREVDLTGRGRAPTPAGDTSRYFEFKVEKPVVPLVAVAPDYPGAAASQGLGGRVVAEYVVDTTGRVDTTTFRVIESSHELFTAAVRQVLPRMRFTPAEVGGRKVKQLVRQPFDFNAPTPPPAPPPAAARPPVTARTGTPPSTP